MVCACCDGCLCGVPCRGLHSDVGRLSHCQGALLHHARLQAAERVPCCHGSARRHSMNSVLCMTTVPRADSSWCQQLALAA